MHPLMEKFPAEKFIYQQIKISEVYWTLRMGQALCEII